jgi:hypothetical protein
VETDATRDAAYEGGVEAQVNKTDRNDARGIAQMMCGSINARGRPWALKLLPIDYEQCCSDRLNPQP